MGAFFSSSLLAVEVDEEEGEEGEVPFDTSMTLTVFRWITGLVSSEVSGAERL